MKVFCRLLHTGEHTGERDGGNVEIPVLVPTGHSGCEKATPSVLPATFRQKGLRWIPSRSAHSSGMMSLGVQDWLTSLLSRFALCCACAKRNWYFFVPVLSSVSLNHHSMLPSAYACDEGSESLETTLFPASSMLWFLTYWRLFYLGIFPASGFLLIFLFLLFALQIREKNAFPVFYFCHGPGSLEKTSFQIYLSRCPPLRNSKGTVEFALKIKQTRDCTCWVSEL